VFACFCVRHVENVRSFVGVKIIVRDFASAVTTVGERVNVRNIMFVGKVSFTIREDGLMILSLSTFSNKLLVVAERMHNKIE
jgi:hypothetical protein